MPPPAPLNSSPPSPSASPPGHAGTWPTRATVFGLQVRADRHIRCLSQAHAQPAKRRLDLLIHDDELGWPDAATVICSRRRHDGTESFRIEADPHAGYLVWGIDCGSYLLSSDGRRMRCAPGESEPAAWERFLIGQALPFAALVSGLEIFHASAVVWEGGAVALAGPSGAGKTSVALALCEQGAHFLADDVLALEPGGDELLAHPGTPLAGIDRQEVKRLDEAGKLPPGTAVMSNRRERLVRVRSSAEQAPLRALFFLDRQEHGPDRPAFEPVSDPQMLLGATFNFVLATPERLHRLLEVGALAARGRAERIAVGPTTDASQLGAAIANRLSVSP